MDEKSLLTVLRTILAQPTAPFHEYSVRNAICELLDDCPDIRLEFDHFGNLLAHYSGTEAAPRWAFGAHMDHPGWVRSLPADTPGLDQPSGPRQRDGFTFLGGLPDAYFESGASLKEFGEFAMWDLTEFKRENGLIASRACDDLAGCAAIVATLLRLQQSKAETCVTGIFTRAEEVGFIGAIELAKSWPLPQDCVFVSIETSIPTAGSRLGKGPMCRVGDRISIFDNDATSTLLTVAEENDLPVQRTLLDRGSCEATALQAYGILTSGISLPLGNYHNCGENDLIKPEYISYADWKTLVDLLTTLAGECPHGPRDISGAQRETFEARAKRYRPYREAAQSKFATAQPQSER